MQKIRELVEGINETIDGQTTQPDTSFYWNLSQQFTDLEGQLREYVQEETAEHVKKIIVKLKNEDNLTPQDLDFVKLWMCGEADYYVQMENNFKDWQEEFVRLVSQIKEYATKDLDYQSASQMRAVSLDAVRVLGDILFYRKQIQRVQNFIESTRDIDADERDLLIRLLEGKLRSPTE